MKWIKENLTCLRDLVLHLLALKPLSYPPSLHMKSLTMVLKMKGLRATKETKRITKSAMRGDVALVEGMGEGRAGAVMSVSLTRRGGWIYRRRGHQ